MNDIKTTLMEYIPAGRENAIQAKELAHLLGINYRAVTMIIHDLRAGGEVICSDNSSDCNGFYKPTCKAEIEKFVKQMKSRTIKIKSALKPAEKALRDMEELNINEITY